MKLKVYLAGPITGLTHDGCTDWREKAAAALNSDSVEALTPMRGKAFLKERGEITSGSYENPVASSKGVTRRDMFDTLRATCLFVNLLGAKRVSIGTVMELAWAYQKQIPTVVLMEKDNVHRHLMVDEACTYIVQDFDEAIGLTKFLLNEEK